jgi:hypothetical protein
MGESWFLPTRCYGGFTFTPCCAEQTKMQGPAMGCLSQPPAMGGWIWAASFRFLPLADGGVRSPVDNWREGRENGAQMALCPFLARQEKSPTEVTVRVRGTIARQKKLPLWVSWLVRKMRSHGWRLIFSLGFKFNKPVAKINYRVLIYWDARWQENLSPKIIGISLL